MYYLRRLSDPLVIKSTGLFGLLLLSWFQVSLLDIVANAPSATQPADFSSFIYRSFLGTELLVKLLAVAVIFFALGLVLSLVRWVRPFVRPSKVWSLMPLRLKS